jgi:predicted HAD superfamily Cof-like phosphohydrolase
MTEEQKHVHDWMTKARQETPDRPSMPDLKVRVLRINLIAEELSELAHAFGLKMCLDTRRGKQPKIEVFENDAKPHLNHHDLVEAYDAVNDLLVVVLGSGIAIGCECKPGFDEVMSSNDSKFGPGAYMREDGKWLKPPGWKPPELGPIVEAQLIAAHNRDKQRPLV